MTPAQVRSDTSAEDSVGRAGTDAQPVLGALRADPKNEQGPASRRTEKRVPGSGLRGRGSKD